MTYVSVQCKYDYLIHARKLSNTSICEKFCKSIACETVNNCSGGIIASNGSYCNCCDVCVKFIGGDCEEIIDGSLRKIVVSKCKTGLKCDKGKCVLEDSENANNCLKHRNWRQDKRGQDNYSDELWVPECDDQGHFKAKQDKYRKRICVDGDGNKLFGSGEDRLENNCECSRYMQKKFEENRLEYSIRPQEHCSPSGSFASIQCINNLCYCADKETGEINSMLVRRDNLDKLPCYDSDKSDKKYLQPCEDELQRSRHLVYELHLKGVELIGVNRVECDPDGSFAPKQCTADRCVCTNEKGVGIGSYQISIDNLDELFDVDMTCNCARAEASIQTTFKCKEYGNYAYFQCFNSENCNCVDNDGDIISKSLPKTSTKEADCYKLLQELMFPNEDEWKTTLAETEVSDDDYEYYSGEFE